MQPARVTWYLRHVFLAEYGHCLTYCENRVIVMKRSCIILVVRIGAAAASNLQPWLAAEFCYYGGN